MEKRRIEQIWTHWKKEITVVIILLALPLSYLIWSLYQIEQNSHEREIAIIDPIENTRAISEIGYILDLRVDRHIFEKKKDIIWWVRIPETDKIYSCSWTDGYAGYEKDEGVILIHDSGSIDDDDWDGYGYIIGLHYKSKAKSTLVWAVDNEELSSD